MDRETNSIQAEENSDFTPSGKSVANVGKRFYTWATLGTFAGACFLVSSLWALLIRLKVPCAANEAWPLLFSFLVIVAFAFASEPEQHTRRYQKIQKGLVTLGNALLVFFTVVGVAAMVT